MAALVFDELPIQKIGPLAGELRKRGDERIAAWTVASHAHISLGGAGACIAADRSSSAQIDVIRRVHGRAAQDSNSHHGSPIRAHRHGSHRSTLTPGS